MSYIEREKVLAEYDRQHKGPPGGARKIIETFPAADVRPNVRGEWISPNGISTCSVCGKAAPFDVEADIIMYWPNLNFCPNCGADMREVITNGN